MPWPVLGRLHDCLRERSGLRDISAAWLGLDKRRKRAAFEGYLQVIECRDALDDFDRRTIGLLHRRLELLPRAAALLASVAIRPFTGSSMRCPRRRCSPRRRPRN